MILLQLRKTGRYVLNHYTIQYFLDPNRASRFAFCVIFFILSTIIGELISSRIEQYSKYYQEYSMENSMLDQKQKSQMITGSTLLINRISNMNIDIKSQQEIISFLLPFDKKQVTLFNNPIKILVDDVTICYSENSKCWYMQHQKQSLPVSILSKEFFENVLMYKSGSNHSLYKVDTDVSILSADSVYNVHKHNNNTIVIHYPNVATEHGSGVWLVIKLHNDYASQNLNKIDDKILLNDESQQLKGELIATIQSGAVFEIRAFHRDQNRSIFVEPSEHIFFKRL